MNIKEKIMTEQDKLINTLTFVGRPFTPTMMNNGTFSKVNMQMENDQHFQRFLRANHLAKKRASLVIFAPESFMYWYGVVTAKQNLTQLQGLMKFVLPAGQIVGQEGTGAANSLDLPLNFVVQRFFKKLIKRGFKVYQNPGDSDSPYFVQSLDLRQKKLTQFWYLKASR